MVKIRDGNDKVMNSLGKKFGPVTNLMSDTERERVVKAEMVGFAGGCGPNWV